MNTDWFTCLYTNAEVIFYMNNLCVCVCVIFLTEEKNCEDNSAQEPTVKVIALS